MFKFLKKKKAKPGLEIPEPPAPGPVPPTPGVEPAKAAEPQKIDIPDKLHEIKIPKKEEMPAAKPPAAEEAKPVIKHAEEIAPVKPPKEEAHDADVHELFKPIGDIAKPKLPEMPELPDIPEVHKKTIAKVTTKEVPEGPLFVKSKDYQDVLAKVNDIKEQIHASENTFKRMNEIKNKKDKVFSQWKESLEDVQRKLIYVEKELFEG